MRHESSLIKFLCCKAWRRSMTGVFFCVLVLSKPTERVRQLACWTIARCFCSGVRLPGELVGMGSEIHHASFGHIEKRLPFLGLLFLCPRNGRRFNAGGASLSKGPGANALRMSGASTARCSWKNRRYRRSWQYLPSERRTSGVDRPSLRRFRQVPSCAHSLLCELRRLRCRSDRLRP